MSRTKWYFFLVMLFVVVAGCTTNNSEFSNEKGIVQEEVGLAGWINNLTSVNSLGLIDYVKWVEDPENGLVKNKKLEKYRYSLLYKPTDYMIAKDLASPTITKTEYDSLQKVYNGFEYYTLSIEDTSFQDELLKSGLTSRSEYEERLLYYSFGMQNDLQLISGTDTIPCSMLHYERTYNISPKANFLIGFPMQGKSTSRNEEVSKTLVYEDKVFKTGIIKLKIEAEAIKEIPSIEIIK